MVKFFEEIEKIVEKYSETNMDDWYYDGLVGSVRVRGNPYEGQIWGVLSELAYIDGVRRIELKLAEDMDEDYDILDIDFLELMKKV